MHPTTYKESLKDKSNHARIPHEPGREKQLLKQHLDILSVSSFKQRDAQYRNRGTATI